MNQLQDTCKGGARYGLRCGRKARIGKKTCHLHDAQELSIHISDSYEAGYSAGVEAHQREVERFGNHARAEVRKK